jgi:type VI secretion system protein VasD
MTLPFRSTVFLILVSAMTCIMTGCGKPRIDLAVASQPNVNPDNSGRPSPVIVKMYELRGDLAFKQNDFYTLFHEPAKALGSDLIAADELVFVPSEARVISYEPMTATRFVGIVAGFRQMERAQWRTIISVDPEEKNTIRIELMDASLVLITDENWRPEKNLRTLQQFSPPPPQTTSGREAGNATPIVDSGSSSSSELGGTPSQEQGYVLPHSRRTQ